MKAKISGPFLLDSTYESGLFDCGIETLNIYLRKYALQHQQSQGSRTYVAVQENTIRGYFTLCYGSVSPESSPERASHGLGRYPIPVMVLARLAVDCKVQGQGLGKALLKHALLKTLNASTIAGLRAVVVHAKNKEAKNFYERYGFLPSPLDEFHLFLLCKDISHNLSR